MMRLIDRKDLKWPYEFRFTSKLHGREMCVTVFIDFYDKRMTSIDCGTLRMTVDQWQAFRAGLGYDEPLSAQLQEQIKNADST